VTRAVPATPGIDPVDLSLTRLRNPALEMLVELEEYDNEAFGATGLRRYDLAVMAEAGAVYVARARDEIAGGCQLMRVLDEPGFCYIVGFYVRPAWQGRGLGRRLLALVAEECRALGIEGLMLTVAPENVRALTLYKSAGFGVEAFAPHFYGEGEDRYVLRWRFAEGGLSGSV
jgi:ribosomal protein S18 acetylase RimI-like enzyme